MLLPLGGVPLIVLAAVVVAMVVVITEFASNIAAASAIMPVVAALVAALGADPILLALPAAFAASWGLHAALGHRPQRDRLGDPARRHAACAQGRARARPRRDRADHRRGLDGRLAALIFSATREDSIALRAFKVTLVTMSDPVESATPRRKPKREVTRLGGRKLKPSTLMMGYGYDPLLSEGALKPPIFLTSTFAFESAEAGKRHFEGITGKRAGGAEGLVYSRFNGPNQEILEDRLGVWDGAEDALVFSSGMSAIATLLLAFCQAGDVILHSGPLYAATEGFIAKVMGRYGVTWLDFPAGAGREEIASKIAQAKEMAAGQGGKLALIYLESPANPTNALVDIEAVAFERDAVFAAEPHPPIAIDNTFLGPLWQSPLKHGADVVVYSLTKYAGGHSDLVAGGVSGAKQWIDPIRALRNTMGTILDPNTAWMLLRSLETLEIRMQRATDNAIKVCDFLKDHSKVEGLGFLGLLREGRRRTSTTATAPARAAPSRCSSKAARPRRSASSTASRWPSSRSASAAPRRSPATPRR